MSADNYYEINPTLVRGEVRFGVNMGFDSDEHEGALPNTRRTCWFDTLDAATEFVNGEYAEYGWSIVQNEVWADYRAAREAAAQAQRQAEVDAAVETAVAAAVQAERARLVTALGLLATYRGEAGATPDEARDAVVQAEGLQLAAYALESGSLDSLRVWLPGWRLEDRQLRELGLRLSATR